MKKNFKFFIDENILRKLNVRKEIENFSDLDNKKFEFLYDKKYKKHFIEWFIPKMNEFLNKNYGEHSSKINIEFFKNNNINLYNGFYKRLFVVIYDNKNLLENQLDNIIFKILYLYDRGYVLNNNLDKFYDLFILMSECEIDKKEYIFKTNNEEKILLDEKFRELLEKVKIKIPEIIKFEHLSYQDRNKIIFESYKGYKLFNIIINHFKLDNKLNYKKNYKLFLNKIFKPYQNKFLEEKYNYFLAFHWIWHIYEEYGFEKISELLYEILYDDKKNNQHKKIIDNEHKDIFKYRDILKLNNYPKLLIELNFGADNNQEKLYNNIKIVNDLIKNICNCSIQINHEWNYIEFWINYYYDWLLYYDNVSFLKDPITFFKQINKDIKEIKFDDSLEYYEKNKLLKEIELIRNEIWAKLEDVTKYNGSEEMKTLIDNQDIDKSKKNKLKKWWRYRSKFFAHSKIEKLSSENYEFLKKLKKLMEECNEILNDIKNKKQI